MRIAYMGVKGLPSKSGTERVLEAIVTRLIKKHEITVYCDVDYTPPHIQYEGVRLIRIPTLKGRRLKPISLGIFSALHAFLFGNYDVIHMHGVENCFTLPLLRLRYRVISSSHGAPGRLPAGKWSEIERFFFKVAEHPFIYLSNYSTAVSIMDCDYFSKRYGKKVIYIPNGVDLDIRVDRQNALIELDRLGLKRNGFLMFAAARIIERKGCHLLLEALNHSKLDIPLLVIGDLEQIPAYGEKLKKMAIGNKVIFFPPIKESSLLFGFLDLCKLFVFPSTSEGMSIMLLEVASLGVPLLCSDIPENKMVLMDHATYFKSEDSNNLSEMIQWVLENPEHLSRIGQEAQAWTKGKFSWDLIASGYELLYQRCLNKEAIPDASFWDQ